MPLDRAAVDHVARLARLDLSDAERSRMETELTQILAHAEKIQTLDLDGIEPTSHAVPIVNALRDDEVAESLPADIALANSPDKEDARFRVPRIIEDQG
jgi:aspartyl-tRNA(Asn)/glutamyl-tRNA(Gln) amidotransferase subunit C